MWIMLVLSPSESQLATSLLLFVLCNNSSIGMRYLIFFKPVAVEPIIYLFIYHYLTKIASSILLKCYQWGSCLSRETPTKEPCRINNFHHRRPYEGLNSESVDTKLNALTGRPRIHKITKRSSRTYLISCFVFSSFPESSRSQYNFVFILGFSLSHRQIK